MDIEVLYQLEGVKERGLAATIVTKTDFSVSTAVLLTHIVHFIFGHFCPSVMLPSKTKKRFVSLVLNYKMISLTAILQLWISHFCPLSCTSL